MMDRECFGHVPSAITYLLEHLDDLILTEVVRQVSDVKLGVLDVFRRGSRYAHLPQKTIDMSRTGRTEIGLGLDHIQSDSGGRLYVSQ